MALTITPTGLRHCPELALLYPKGETHLREEGAREFYHGKTEDDRFKGWLKYQFCTWPTYVGEVQRDSKGLPRIKPSTFWNPWMERKLRAFMNEKYAVRQGDKVFRFIGLTGVGGSAKTHDVSQYALGWWAIDPDNSIVILTSTTKLMIRSRVWSQISKYWNGMQDLQTGVAAPVGHLIESQMMIQARKGDSLHSISAHAVADGETQKAIHNLKGMHAPRMLVVVDECNGTPEAILEVVPNYLKACNDFTLIAIGNPGLRLDTHGRLCKPSEGWQVAEDRASIEWRTEGVPEWQVESGVCLRFDGRDSPNVKLKRNVYPYIYTYDDYLKAERHFQQHGATANLVVMDWGMWPLEGMSNTVFTEQLFMRCDAIGTHFTFVSQRESYCYVDLAFGGDACIMQFGEVGDGKVEGEGSGEVKQVLQLTDTIEVPIDPGAAQQDRDYQVARWIINECRQRNIQPENFGVDATGTGRGAASIITAEWSSRIHYINWGTGATERPSSQFDGRPAREVYSTYVGECWWALRDGLEAGQVKGFGREAVVQLCARQFEMQGKRYRMETKPEMKLRLRYSPDQADAAVGLFEVARKNGLVVAGKVALSDQQAAVAGVRAAQEVIAEPVVAAASGWADSDGSSDDGDADSTYHLENGW